MCTSMGPLVNVRKAWNISLILKAKLSFMASSDQANIDPALPLKCHLFCHKDAGDIFEIDLNTLMY